MATILNSVTAIDVSLQVVRTFVRFREILSSHAELPAARRAARRSGMTGKLTQIFAVLRDLLEAPSTVERKRIGFRDEERA